MKAFVILGMHRSATSLVAGGLNKFGVNMGSNFIKSDRGNPMGYWENKKFRILNGEILHRAGGSWDNPPPRDKILALKNEFAPRIKDLIKESELPLWGWKDPRTILTIELYLPYLKNPHFICCFRDPMEVAKSLQRRNKFPLEKGLVSKNIQQEIDRIYL